MKCDYCNGVGTYDPFTGPTAECPKCKGTGHIGKVGPSDADFEALRVFGDVPKVAPLYAEERKLAAQQAKVRNDKFQNQADAAIDTIYNKHVIVKYHPGCKIQDVAGDVTEVESYGPHIQRIKVSEGGYIHDIGMQDVESIRDYATGQELWPGSATKQAAAKFHVASIGTLSAKPSNKPS